MRMVSRLPMMTRPFIQATFRGRDQQESESEEQGSRSKVYFCCPLIQKFPHVYFVRITTQRTAKPLTSEDQTNISDVGKSESEEEETSGSEE